MHLRCRDQRLLSQGFSGTWPAWGMMRNGELLERSMPVLPTYENASGYWPTPCAQFQDTNAVTWARRSLRLGRCASLMLSAAVHMVDNGIDLSLPRERLHQLALGCSPVRGVLSPDWNDWLVGIPIGWSALGPLETSRFREWWHLHSDCSTPSAAGEGEG